MKTEYKSVQCSYLKISYDHKHSDVRLHIFTNKAEALVPVNPVFIAVGNLEVHHKCFRCRITVFQFKISRLEKIRV